MTHWPISLLMELSQIGGCCDTNVDSPDIVILTEGSRACHSVRIAVNERETDTLDHVILTESIKSIPDVPIKMTVWMIGRSRISSSF
jgi:hypothetical protein